ncbi:MAG: hypothetical protein RIS70_3336, partial [Planctomycetota bacterium]
MSKPSSFWFDKTVLITGASSGIGRGLAQHCVRAGARVGLIARRSALLEELAEELATELAADATPQPQSNRPRCAWRAADVGNAEQMREAMLGLEAELGPCDVVIANAGIYRKTDGLDFDANAANQVVVTNLQGVINAFAPVLPGMVQRRRGNLVAVTSLLAMLGYPGAAAYSASKAAVVRLMDCLRIDLHSQGIRVTTVCPGYVDTAMITDHDRATVKSIVPVDVAARKIAKAIERGKARCEFPRSLRLLIGLAGWLPEP